ERGRLRTFLLRALRRFLVDQYRRDSRQKRGGDVIHVPIHITDGESKYVTEPIDQHDPETLFNRAWAQSLLMNAQVELRKLYEAAGKTDQLTAIEPFLDGQVPEVTYRELALRLNTTETALGLLIYRARKKFRSLIESEIRRTASDPAETAEELLWFRTLLGQ
ncbi:MAG: hypothetical protein FJ405_19145, partial [Verrucomicrobia bacterium]|nr:hypothetical protein [Verrucomicrobiota bacterium]